MKKRFYLPVIATIIIILVSITVSCVPPMGSSATASSANSALVTRLEKLEAASATSATSDAKFTSDISELQANKLSKSDYTGSTDTYEKTELYTRAEVDAKIKSLQNQINDLKDSNSSDSDNNSDTSNLAEDKIVDENEDLTLYLTSVNPTQKPFLLSDSEDIHFDFTVKNSDTSNSHRFEVKIEMYPDEDILVYTTTDGEISSDVDMEVAIEPQDDVTPLPEGDPLSIRCTKGWVGKNDTQDFALIVNMETGSTAEWDYNITIRQTD